MSASRIPPMPVSHLIWLDPHDRLGIASIIPFDVRATSCQHRNTDPFYVLLLVIDTSQVNSQHSPRDIVHSHGFPAYQINERRMR
jgi:hypothetical protein